MVATSSFFRRRYIPPPMAVPQWANRTVDTYRAGRSFRGTYG
jgi:hypothetical protein